MFLYYYSETQNKADKRKLYPTLPGWPSCTYSYGKISPHLRGIPAKKQVKSHLGGLALFSYEHYEYFEFLEEGEISPWRASPPNRVSSPLYEQPLNNQDFWKISFQKWN